MARPPEREAAQISSRGPETEHRGVVQGVAVGIGLEDSHVRHAHREHVVLVEDVTGLDPDILTLTTHAGGTSIGAEHPLEGPGDAIAQGRVGGIRLGETAAVHVQPLHLVEGVHRRARHHQVDPRIEPHLRQQHQAAVAGDRVEARDLPGIAAAHEVRAPLDRRACDRLLERRGHHAHHQAGAALGDGAPERVVIGDVEPHRGCARAAERRERPLHGSGIEIGSEDAVDLARAIEIVHDSPALQADANDENVHAASVCAAWAAEKRW